MERALIASKNAETAGLVRMLRIEDVKNTRKFLLSRQKREQLKRQIFREFCKHFKFNNKPSSASCNIEKVIT
jgi:hypothetical protein